MPTALALWLVMDDLKRQRDQLEKELRGATEALDRKLESMGSTWQAGLGSLSVRATLDSYFISMIYILFNAACFAAGITFIFLNNRSIIVHKDREPPWSTWEKFLRQFLHCPAPVEIAFHRF